MLIRDLKIYSWVFFPDVTEVQKCFLLLKTSSKTKAFPVGKQKRRGWVGGGLQQDG